MTTNNQIITLFNNNFDQQDNFSLLLSGSNLTCTKFRQLLINELERSNALQQTFLKNPKSFFASALFCAELHLSPSSLIGEFYFTSDGVSIKPILGYKGLITLLMRCEKIKKIWCEVVYNEDDFEYELGLEPKMVHIPNFNTSKTSDNIKCIYACAKINDETIFKVMTLEEIKSIIELLKNPSSLYFDDKKDPEKWLLKKVVLKQMAKLLPKDDDRVLKAVSYDDNLEGGGYLVLDDNNTVRVVQGTIIGKQYGKKKPSIYENLNMLQENDL